ncbi:MAG: Holliday junction branch migration protein RuvA [Candidatus Spechtbacterales bacterium]
MIAYLEGKIKYIGDNFVEVFNGNISYKIFCTAKTLATYAAGQEAEIFTHLHVREDLLNLYGFKSREERDFFEQLIGISGIGPKGAMGVLSAGPLDLLKKGIASGDTSILTRVSGIGQKTAQRIIMELKDKVGGFGMGEGDSLREGGDVIEALTGLGYTRYQAQQALREIPENISGVENKVKEALKLLSK